MKSCSFASLALLVLVSFATLAPAQETAPQPPQLKIFKLANLSANEAYYSVQMLLSLRTQQTPPPSYAVDQRAKSLFARGTAEQLAEIEKLLQTLDRPLDQLTEAKLPSVTIFPVKQGDVRTVSQVLTSLQIRNQIVQLGKGGVILVGAEPASAATEARDIVKTLDVPADPAATVAAE